MKWFTFQRILIFRCLASVVAVCVAISLMLQNKHYDGKTYDMKSIKQEAQRRAAAYLEEEGFAKYVSNLKLVKCLLLIINPFEPGRIAQSVTCLATDASLPTDPRVVSSIPAWSHTFVEIDYEIISTVILLPFPESIKKDCCQLQAKVCAQSTG